MHEKSAEAGRKVRGSRFNVPAQNQAEGAGGAGGGRIVRVPPISAAGVRPSRSWKAPPTRSLERLRYVAHAFQRAGSGGFPAARWWYFQDAPAWPGTER